jgi:hypothetical protein
MLATGIRNMMHALIHTANLSVFASVAVLTAVTGSRGVSIFFFFSGEKW